MKTSQELVIPPDVRELLVRHEVEEDFRILCDLAKECYPDVRSWEVRWMEDVDEEDRVNIDLFAFLPESYPQDRLHAMNHTFFEELAKRLPPSRTRRYEQKIGFTVLPWFQPDEA